MLCTGAELHWADNSGERLDNLPSRYSFNCLSITSTIQVITLKRISLRHSFSGSLQPHFEVLCQKDLIAYQTYHILSRMLAKAYPSAFFKFCKQVLMYNMLSRFLRCWLYSCCIHGLVTNLSIKPSACNCSKICSSFCNAEQKPVEQRQVLSKNFNSFSFR